jgi:hypothetical protein
MTTAFKSGAASLATALIMWVNIFSHLLGIPESIQTILAILAFVPLGFVAFYLAKWRQERAAAIASGVLPFDRVEIDRRKGKRRLIVLWVCMFPFTLSSPFWLPAISGRSLGRLGDFVNAFVTFVVLSVIIWIQLKKKPNHVPDPTFSSGTPPAEQETRHR